MTASAYIRDLTFAFHSFIQSSPIQSLSYDPFYHLIYALLASGWVCVFSLDNDGNLFDWDLMTRIWLQAS